MVAGQEPDEETFDISVNEYCSRVGYVSSPRTLHPSQSHADSLLTVVI